MGRKLIYLRVSSESQNLDRQIDAMMKIGADLTYSEKLSGKNARRPQLQRMLKEAQEGDTIYIHDFSRIARSTIDLLTIIEDLERRGIRLVSLKENVDTSTPTGKLMITMIGAMNEFERMNLLERQREGIQSAKKRGTYTTHRRGGMKRRQVDPVKFEQVFQQYANGKISLRDAVNQFDIGQTALHARFQARERIGKSFDVNADRIAD